jgi:hypothetical protein
MKSFVLALTLLLVGNSSFATRNPQIRACVTVGGQFFVVNSAFDEIGLCRIDASLVGAIDILNRDSGIEVPLSLYNYKKGVKSCSTQNLTTLYTFEGEPIYVCLYSDGSILDVETLTTGKDSPRNQELNKVIGL